MNIHRPDNTLERSNEFAKKLRQLAEASVLKELTGKAADPFLAEIESHLDGISLQEFMAKENDELLAEMDAYIESSTEEDCDANRILVYLAVLQEKAPVKLNIDADSLKAGIEDRLSVAVRSSHKQEQPSRHEQERPPRKSWRSKLAWAAAGIVLIIFFTTSTAYGNNFISHIVKWGEGVFQIGRRPAGGLMELPADSGAEYRSLADALAENGISSANIPTWIPEEFSLTQVSIEKGSQRMIIIAEYHNTGGGYLAITVNHDPNSTGRASVEANHDIPEDDSVYMKDGEVYRLATNIEASQASWGDDYNSYFITGVITIDELKMMIDSIYER